MRLEIHAGELTAKYGFSCVPEGPHEVRVTAYPDDDSPFDFQWPVEMKDGTLIFPACHISEDGKSVAKVNGRWELK